MVSGYWGKFAANKRIVAYPHTLSIVLMYVMKYVWETFKFDMLIQRESEVTSWL